MNVFFSGTKLDGQMSNVYFKKINHLESIVNYNDLLHRVRYPTVV